MIKKLLAIAFISASALGSAQTQVHLEDFQGGIPANYTIVDNDGLTPNAATADFADAWISLPDPLDSTDTIAGSTSYFEPIGTADRWLITPQINLGAFGNFLYWESRSQDPSFPDGYYVMASKTDTQLTSFTDTLFFIGGELSTWTSQSVNLSDFGLDGEQVHIAFVNRTYDGFKLYLDSISVFVDDPVGINELNALEVQMYPNPASENVYFNQALEVINVYSMRGESILSAENTTSINISNLPVGIYHLELKKDGHTISKKLVKN